MVRAVHASGWPARADSVRGVHPQRLVAGIVVALVGAVVLLAMAQFRTYSSNYSTDEALTLLVQTPPSAYTVSDLSTFDNLVAIRELVPSSVPYLDGESFKWIPELLVPRALWHGKPLGLDFLASAYFYPGVLVGTPVSLQGELYWNDGLWTVAGGAFVVGALMGMLGRWGLTRARGRGGFVLYVVALTSTHAFLTRSLAIMTSSLVLALIGSAIAVAATGRWSPRTAVAATLARLRRGDRRPAPSPVQP